MNTSLFHLVFYYLVAGLLRLLLTFCAHVQYVVSHEMPTGAFILASNHISHFDPPFLSGWFQRKIDWMAMSQLFQTRWSNLLFHWLDVIPIDRHGDDRQALREALRRLKKGRVIGIFPEGGIRDGTGSMLAGASVREGAVMLALQAHCPLVPVVILGSERLYNLKNLLPWRRAKVYIGVGAALSFPTVAISRGAARKQLQAEFATAIIRLKDDLFAKYQLSNNDFPHSPQQRISEP